VKPQSSAKGDKVSAVIRQYKSEDFQACRALWAELTEWHRHIYDDSTIGGSDPGSHFDVHLKEHGSEHIWVAEVDGRVIGMAGLIHRRNEAELEPLIVSEEYRHSGIGRQLVETVTRAARKEGANMLSVEPVARNDLAIRFFHDLGFDTLGHMEMFIDFSPPERQKWKGTKRIADKDFRY